MGFMAISVIANAATNTEVVGMLEGYVETCNKKKTFIGHAFIGKAVINFGKGSPQQRADRLRASDEYQNGKNLVSPDFCITIGFLLEDMGLSKATTDK